MSKRRFSQLLSVAILLSAPVWFAGCGQGSTSGPTTGTEVGHNEGAKEVAKTDDHSGWWCPEHGIPESECSICDASVAAEFQKKGDWCKEHDRALSQCFICTPKAKEKYAALYKAKFGTEPPAIEDETPNPGKPKS